MYHHKQRFLTEAVTLILAQTDKKNHIPSLFRLKITQLV